MGHAELQRHGSATSGRSHGAVRNVDSNELLSSATGMGSQTGGIPLPVTGTVESPRVRPSVGKMVSSAAGELLNSFFKKKTK